MSAREVVADPTRAAEIKEKLATVKITDAQIDPFGFCNAKCWFCPVRYQKNPPDAAKHMLPDVLDRILSQLVAERERSDGVVDKSFAHFYTAHYNEILLYKYLDELLFLTEYYKLRTMILSNGINLTDEKIEVLARHKNALSGINLNIPAFEPDLWRERSGITHRPFDVLVRSVRKTMETFPEMVANKTFSIGVNVPSRASMVEHGGWMDLGPNAPSIDLGPDGELERQVKLGRELFPGLQIYPVPSLVDRAAILAKHGVIDNSRAVARFRQGAERASNCSNGTRGRIYGWLHVNALGQAFLCCNDYDFDYTFGSFHESTLRELWLSDAHVDMVDRALGEICVSCASAVWR